MAIEVEFMSKEFIKPSSPTPNHLRKLKFSFIDQLNNIPGIVPFIIFYEKSSTFSNQQISKILKQSLSKALTVFYPLAGRINNFSYADCNDEGALFIENKANCQLSNILQNRDQYHKHRPMLVPPQPQQGKDQYGSLIQVTYFECGGLAISFAMPHSLGDALSNFTFLKCWAAVARGDLAYLANIPPMGTSSIFPSRNVPPGSDLMEMVLKENVITKSFVFDDLTLSGLRDEYSHTSGKKLSRVQALSAFILSRIRASVSRLSCNENKQIAAVNAINTRPLIVDPPVSKQYSFGNLVWVAVALIGKEDECHEIGRKIRDSIKSVNSKTVKKIQSDEQPLDLWKEAFAEVADREMDKCVISSLCNFQVYEIDFGWGEPEWVTSSVSFVDNVLVHFFDTKRGRGIEACITMDEEDMADFEKDSEFLLLAQNGKQNIKSRL